MLPVNDVMIPSKAVNSRSVTHYDARFADKYGKLAKRFYIEDVDIFGKPTKHGPFTLGQASGVEDLDKDVVKTNWKEFKALKTQRDKQRNHEFALKLNKKGKLTGQGRLKNADKRGNGQSGGGNTLVTTTASGGSGLTIRVLVGETGIYRVTYDDLAALGLTLESVNENSISLTNRGVPVPVHVYNAGGGFGPGSYVEFLGQAYENLYTDHNVYDLDLMSSSGTSQMPQQNAGPKGRDFAQYYMYTERREQNNIYNFTSPLKGDPWQDTQQLAVHSQSVRDFSLPATDVAAVPGTSATITAQLVGGLDYLDDDADHHAYLYFDGASVGEDWFDGLSARTISAQIPSDQVSSQNTVETYVPADTKNGIDLIYVESLELTYPRKFTAIDDRLMFKSDGGNFSVTGFSTDDIVAYALTSAGPVRLTKTSIESSGSGYTVKFSGVGSGATYFVSTGDAVLAPELDTHETHSLAGLVTNNLVITHPSLMGSTLDDYLAARSAITTGTTQVVNVFDIYDQYSDGITDGEAIRRFITDVASRSDLHSVLIVGGDTYDYKGYLNVDTFSFVPTIYRQTGDVVRFSAVDALFGDIDGDGVPDVPVGRLPVRSVEELATVADKIIAYDNGSGDSTAVFAADNTEASDAYNFTDMSELVASPLEQDGWSVTRAYLDQMSVADARDKLISGIDSGPRLTVYTGHSNSTQWTYDGLFTSSDAMNLTNHGHPTVVVQWGCWNTYFVDPLQDSLGHIFLLSGDQGAAAVVGASTLTDAGAEKNLATLLHTELAQKSESIGEAMINAKQEYAAKYGSGDVDLLWGETILGDPLVKVK